MFALKLQQELLNGKIVIENTKLSSQNKDEIHASVDLSFKHPFVEGTVNVYDSYGEQLSCVVYPNDCVVAENIVVGMNDANLVIERIFEHIFDTTAELIRKTSGMVDDVWTSIDADGRAFFHVSVLEENLHEIIDGFSFSWSEDEQCAIANDDNEPDPKSWQRLHSPEEIVAYVTDVIKAAREEASLKHK